MPGRGAVLAPEFFASAKPFQVTAGDLAATAKGGEDAAQAGQIANLNDGRTSVHGR
jgi:hypothetical protein